jgi:hypothetical protein
MVNISEADLAKRELNNLYDEHLANLKIKAGQLMENIRFDDEENAKLKKEFNDTEKISRLKKAITEFEKNGCIDDEEIRELCGEFERISSKSNLQLTNEEYAMFIIEIIVLENKIQDRFDRNVNAKLRDELRKQFF